MPTEIMTQEVALSARDLRKRVNLIQQIMKEIMKENVHYGVIPGCKKPSLYKAGAEQLASAFQIAIESRVEDLSTQDEKRFRVTCIATSSSGSSLGSSTGECSSSEEKYKWRRPVCKDEFEEADTDRKREKWVNGKDGPQKIQQIRTEPSDIANTILQMADKRAYVSIVRKVTAASDIFTQDIEDIPEELRGENETTEARPQISTPKPKNQTSNGDFRLMKSKYDSTCKGCGDPIKVGEDIYYSQKAGVFHKACKESPEQKAEPVTTDELASEKHIENLKKLASQVGLADIEFLEFLDTQGVKNVDALTVTEYQKCLLEIGRRMDEKAKTKKDKTSAKS